MAVIAAHVTAVFGTGTAAVDISTADGTGMGAATVIARIIVVPTVAPTIGVTMLHPGSTVTGGTIVRGSAAV